MIVPQDPEPFSRAAGVLPSAYIFLKTLFLPHIEQYIPQRDYGEYIYISRRDAGRRRVVNEECIPSKFTQISMSGLPLLEQMHIFYHAKVIIALHGAALVNILFCKPSTKIIEIASESMGYNHFEHIADIMELDYIRFIDVEELQPGFDNTDLMIRGNITIP